MPTGCNHPVECYLLNKHNLTSIEAAELTALFQPVELNRNQVLVRQGNVWNQAYYLEYGLLRLFYSTANGKEFNKGFFAEGDLIWPIAPSARTESSLFTIASLESCRIYSASFELLKVKLDAMAKWTSFALPYVEKLADQKYLREYQFLVHDAQSRYTQLYTELGPLLNRIPDYHIASYLGITNVALSRIKSRLAGKTCPQDTK